MQRFEWNLFPQESTFVEFLNIASPNKVYIWDLHQVVVLLACPCSVYSQMQILFSRFILIEGMMPWILCYACMIIEWTLFISFPKILDIFIRPNSMWTERKIIIDFHAICIHKLSHKNVIFRSWWWSTCVVSAFIVHLYNYFPPDVRSCMQGTHKH